jgi:hypothetical protein
VQYDPVQTPFRQSASVSHIEPGSPPRHEDSAQIFESHSPSVSQGCPIEPDAQVPPPQWRPERQCASSVQLVPGLPLTQLPELVLPVRQIPDWHWLAVVQTSPSRPPLHRLPLQRPKAQSVSA